jgi:CDGSH-type Zn-finger protein
MGSLSFLLKIRIRKKVESMTRVVFKEVKTPYVLKDGDSKYICMCGLSSNQPFCDGSHTKIKEDQGKFYSYKNGEQREIKIIEE